MEKVEVAGPGFINFFMDNSYLRNVIPTVLQAGAAYGETNEGAGKKIQVEFVSANPTGNLHLGHARGATVGDALCRILSKAGYEVEREYYINDAGNQIEQLASSLEARYFQALGRIKKCRRMGITVRILSILDRSLLLKKGINIFTSLKKKDSLFFRQYGLAKELEKK